MLLVMWSAFVGNSEGLNGMGHYRDDDLKLVVEWTRHDQFLAGSYTIENVGDARILIFDRLYQTAPSGFRTVDPDLAYRWLERDGTYRVAKFVPAVPHGTKVESPEVPYARVLEPGGVLSGSVLFPVPLVQLLPYDAAADDLTQSQITGISLTLGIAEVDDALISTEIGKGELVTYSVRHAWVFSRQKLISTPVMAMNLPVQK